MSAGGLIKLASGAGSIVMVCTCIVFTMHISVKSQLYVIVLPQMSNVPISVGLTIPSIRHAPVPPLVYIKSDAIIVGALAQLTVMSAGGLVKVGGIVGSMVMV